MKQISFEMPLQLSAFAPPSDRPALEVLQNNLLEDLGEALRQVPLQLKKIHLEIHLGVELPANLRARMQTMPLFRFKGVQCWGLSGPRLARESDGTSTIFDFKSRRILVYSENADRLREVAYLAVLSLCGEDLDRAGFHRIHALGLRNARGRAELFVMDQGTGKSTAAYDLRKKLQEAGVEIFSDEVPLVDGRHAFAFPVPMALIPDRSIDYTIGRSVQRSGRRKILFRLSQLWNIAAPSVIDEIYFCQRGAGLPRTEPLGKFRSFRVLLEALILGIGAPQMGQYLLRWDGEDPFYLLKILRSRVLAALRIWTAARFHYVYFGENRAENMNFLQSLILTRPRHRDTVAELDTTEAIR